MSVTPRSAVTAIVAGAVAISLAPILVKLLAKEGLGLTAIALWRVWLATGVLFALARLRGAPLRLPRHLWWLPVLAGGAFAVDLFVWHRSIAIVGAGMATILANTQVFWTSALGRLLYKEHLSLQFALAALLAFAGVTLLAGFGSEVTFDAVYLSGIGLGLTTGVAYACYVVTLRHAAGASGQGHGAPDPFGQALVTLAWVTLACGMGLLLLSLAEGAALAPRTSRTWLLLAALSMGVQVLGWLAISWSLPQIPASRAALLLLIQPTLATFWGWAIFGEELAPSQLLGAGLTLAAIYAGSLGRSR